MDFLAKSNPKITTPKDIIRTFKTAFVTPTESTGKIFDRTTENPDTPPAAISCCIKKKYKPAEIKKDPKKIHIYFFILFLHYL